jgi:protein-histidine N-methyltransferase
LISEDARDGVAKKEQDEVKDRIQALEFLDAPSDLVPGVYEGGLKTWECSLDLVDYLDSTNGGDIRGRRVLEV